jgi:hypothetical protein
MAQPAIRGLQNLTRLDGKGECPCSCGMKESSNLAVESDCLYRRCLAQLDQARRNKSQILFHALTGLG